MRMLIVTMLQLRECGQRGGGLGGHPGHDGEWPLIRLSGVRVDTGEAMFGKWLVTLSLWPGPLQRRDGARQAWAGVSLVTRAGQDEECSSGTTGDVLCCHGVIMLMFSYWCLGCLGSQQGRGGVCKDGTDAG